MSVTWGSIYADIVNILLESGSFSLGLLTDAMFYQMASEVEADFVGRGGLIKRISNIPLHFSIGTYAEPEELSDLQAVAGAGRSLYRTSGYYLDNSDADWMTATGLPESFREDELNGRQIEITPAPAFEGTQIYTTNAWGTLSSNTAVNIGPNPAWPFGYGILSTASGSTTFSLLATGGYGTVNTADGTPAPSVSIRNPGYGILNFLTVVDNGMTVISGSPSSASTADFVFVPDVATPAGYGTIGAAKGNPYLEPQGLIGWGLFAGMVPSTSNLELFGTALPDTTATITATTVIASVPDSFTPYLKYGILARIFSTDSELKDDNKAQYALMRYQEGIGFLAALFGEEGSTDS